MASSKKLDIDPELLIKSAQSIEEKTATFTQIYNSIFTAVSELKADFIGEAGTAFQQKIENYKPQFEDAEKNLKTYCQKLTQYAQDVRGVDQAMAS